MDDLGAISSLSASQTGGAAQARLFKGQEQQLETVVSTLFEGVQQSAASAQAYAAQGIGQKVNVVA